MFLQSDESNQDLKAMFGQMSQNKMLYRYYIDWQKGSENATNNTVYSTHCIQLQVGVTIILKVNA